MLGMKFPEHRSDATTYKEMQMIIDDTIKANCKLQLKYNSLVGKISRPYLKLAFHIQRKEILLMHGNVFRNMAYPEIGNKYEQET